METDIFYDLYNFFNTPLKFIEIGSEPIFNLKIYKFYQYSQNLVSHYRGECTRRSCKSNISKKEFYKELQNNRTKFSDSFKYEFGIDYDEIDSNFDKILSTYKHYGSEKFPWKIALKMKIKAYKSSIKIIDEYLNSKPKRGFKHKANIEEFDLGLDNEGLDELCDLFIAKELIDEKTNYEDFRNAFSGKKNRNHIKWMPKARLLYLLIKKINEERLFKNIFTHGMWDIVIDIFKPIKPIHGNKHFYDITSLTKSKNSGKTDLTPLIEEISDRIKFLKKEHD